MEDTIHHDKPPKSGPSANQTQQPTPSGNGVFLMRAKGQSFEEFRDFCIKRFREAGLIKD